MPADEETFLEQMASETSDDVRLVYADWLEERGDLRAEFLRLEVSLHKGTTAPSIKQRFAELAKEIDPAWRQRIDRVTPNRSRPRALGPPARAAAAPPTTPGPAQVPSWARLRSEGPGGGLESSGEPLSPAMSFAVGGLLLVAAVFFSGCEFVTHVECHGASDGVCSIHNYGLFTSVRHIDVPVREIVEVSVDERRGRKGPSVATVAILTRSMGSIDLAGGQLLSSTFEISDAVEAATALRRLRSDRGGTPRKRVDLWLGPSRLGAMITVSLALLCWLLLARLCWRAVSRHFRARHKSPIG